MNEISPFEIADPAEPVATWFGGKRNLAKRLIARLEAIPHKLYAEPFVGMGGIFLRRAQRPRYEAINDINGEIVNLFRIMREHPDELCRQFELKLTSREEFVRLVKLPADVLTDVQRAARFLYVQRLCFSGKAATMATPGQIGARPYYRAKNSPPAIARLVRRAHRRLREVHIECLEWEVFIRRYDGPHTMFYLDPPYWGQENDYGKDLFAREDYGRMAELLAGIKGRFVMSLNDRPETRDAFRAFAIEPVSLRYSASPEQLDRVATELLISN